MDSREILIYQAKLAEQAGRYEDIIVLLKTLVNLDVELTAEERDLLHTGYKYVVGKPRASCLALMSMEMKEGSRRYSNRVMKMSRKYRKRLESEIEEICKDFIGMVDEHLIPSARAAESLVFYYKWKGDCNRYLAEFQTGDEGRGAAKRSFEAYQMGESIAKSDLAPAHPFRLGLALNFSVFCYEILEEPERACTIAHEANDLAFIEMAGASKEKSYKDSISVMRPIKDNLDLWFQELYKEGGSRK